MSDAARPAPAPVRRTVLTLVAEPVIRELLAQHLKEAGFFPVGAASAGEARRLAGEVLPDVLLLDPDSADSADLAFCAQLPEQVRIVVTSGAPACCTHVPNVSLCLHKPYAPRDLVAHLNRLPELPAGAGTVRHASAPVSRDGTGAAAPSRLQRCGPLEIDLDRHLITVQRQGLRVELELSPVELRLLQCLVEQAGRVLTREVLRTRVWGEGAAVDLRTVDQNIRRLRRELGEADAGDLIRTVRGIGYRLGVDAGA